MITVKEANLILDQMVGYRPSDTIVQRGIDLFEIGAVESYTETRPDSYWVKVFGETNDYRLQIRTHGEAFVECDCPYDQDVYCKHGVAALLRIFFDHSVSKNKRKGSIKLNQLLSKLSAQELIEFLLTKAENDEEFLRELTDYFAPSRADSEQVYKEKSKQIFRTFSGKHGFIDYQTSFFFEREMSNFLKKAQSLIRVKPLDALYIAGASAETVLSAAQQMDDSSGLTSSLINESLEIIESVANINDKIHIEIFRICLSLYQNATAEDLGFSDEYFEVLLSLNLPQEPLDSLIKHLDKRIKTEKEGSYQTEKMILQKYKILERLGRKTEGLSFLQSYIEYPTIRSRFVKKNISEQKYEDAEHLILEGIEIAQNERDLGYVHLWKNDLLELMEIRRKKEEAFQIAKELFLVNCKNEYKLIMQRNLPKKEWKKNAEEISNIILTTPRYLNRYEPIRFLLDEGFVKKVIPILGKDNFHMFFHFYPELIQGDKHQTIEIGLSYIEEKAKNISSRPEYKDLVKKMKLMAQSAPSGKKEILSLAAKFTSVYKIRPAMIDELKKGKLI
ncbi:hypothetical protein JWG44_02915 [Leptospira sp. 201903071]|uniref:SWIM zinc finger family protein n=1 Tax=Leptospira ainazelensis TaxID=2810034 RepID=UPI001962FAAE|nr:hypothetical protein [Leptospira ainazelensis]MBM9499204.1 hypothetical protein [Leptospira ainazelensis]